VSERLPVVSGAQLIDVLQKLGWEVTRQRGNHVRLKHQGSLPAYWLTNYHSTLRRKAAVAASSWEECEVCAVSGAHDGEVSLVECGDGGLA
jgi:hypothetical protein